MSLFIDDNNFQEVVDASVAAGFEAGALPRQTQIGELACALVFSEHIPIIPPEEWVPRIKDMQAAGGFIGQRFQPDPKAHYQNGTPLCWAFSLGEAIEGVIVSMGQPYRLLAPESILGVCNYRKQGFYLDRALEWVAEHGMARREFVPQMYSSNPREWKQGWEQDALNNVALEWFDLGGKDVWAETVTALLSGFGCYVGYDWWSHAVFLDQLAVNDKGQIVVHSPNSHGPGNDVWLTGNKAVPSMGSFVLRSVTYSG